MMFAIHPERHGTTAVLRLTGELDWVSAGQLEHCFDEVLRGGATDIRLDVRRLTFCDAAALSTLIRGGQRCAAAGGRLSISGATGVVARILKITGLDEHHSESSTRQAVQQDRQG